MHGRYSRQDGGLALVLRAGLAVAGLALCQARAQDAPPPARVEPLDITGSNFAGVRLPVSVTTGEILLKGTRAWTWVSPGTPGRNGTGAPEARRVLLSGDVTVRLGTYEFQAARAAVWMSPLAPGDPEAAPDVFQIFVFFDRAWTPTEDAAVGVTGDRLPVQGIMRTGGNVRLAAVVSKEGPSPDEADLAFVREGERALAVRLRAQVTGKPARLSPDDLARANLPIPPLHPGLGRTYERRPADDRARLQALESRLGPADRDEPIFARTGVITFSAGQSRLIVGKDENAVEVWGGVTVQYWERETDNKLELTAASGTVFLRSDASGDSSQFTKDQVLGIYLEGDVIATIVTAKGRYSIRSPKVFYSIKDDRATLLDAVFWTYDEQLALPLYVRAKSISQESANQFKATSASMTNTAFLDPDFSVGTSTLTLSRRTRPDGENRLHVDARNIVMYAGPIPFFYWPILRGEPDSVPLKNIEFGSSSGSGTVLKTVWNLYGLLGVEKLHGDDQADLLVDWHFERGEAFGTNLTWGSATNTGALFAYTLPEDRGKDLLVTGEKKQFNREARGLVTFEDRLVLNEEWTLFAEASYVSDVTFLDGLFEDMAQQRRELTNSLYARRLRENTALWAEARGMSNNFLVNQYLIQSPGYAVEKLPEVGYKWNAEDLIASSPGLLTYTSEYRLSHMRLLLNEAKANEFGFSNPTQANTALGITPTESVADRLRRQGYIEEPVDRFDTRHELGLQLAAGSVSVQPFVTGRATVYDDRFTQFSPNEDEKYRLWGSEGLSMSTELQYVDNGAESRLFDIHRMRHIVQPNLTVWHANSTMDRKSLPVYDDDVESLADGTTARFAVDQTWQTQRGGPGRWRSVDVFKLNTELFTSSSEIDKESPIGRYIDYRPELSNLGGTYGAGNAAWQVTEVFGLGASTVYDFETQYLQKTSLGGTLRHTPDFSTFAELRTVNSQDLTYVIVGESYQLTPKYSLDMAATYDVDGRNFQYINANITRRYQSVTLGVGLSYNYITHDLGFGVSIAPGGTQRPGARLEGLGKSGPAGVGG